MPQAGYLYGDLQIQGSLYVQGGFTPPANSIVDASVAASAAVAATKLQHQHRAIYAQGSSTTAAAATQVIFAVFGATGTVVNFEAGAVVPNVGAATCTVDLKKNGTSILGAAISLSSSQTARQLVAATISNTALVAGDVLEVVVTATAGGGTLAQGLFATLTVNEMPL
jgi:hypothetical protein